MWGLTCHVRTRCLVSCCLFSQEPLGCALQTGGAAGGGLGAAAESILGTGALSATSCMACSRWGGDCTRVGGCGVNLGESVMACVM